jgi:hypothetical protein
MFSAIQISLRLACRKDDLAPGGVDVGNLDVGHGDTKRADFARGHVDLKQVGAAVRSVTRLAADHRELPVRSEPRPLRP